MVEQALRKDEVAGSSPASGSIRVGPDDVFGPEKLAYVRITPGARVAICEMAGAPWNDKVPDARLSPLQVEVLSRSERSKYVHGGSRVGKSVLGGCEGILELLDPMGKMAVAGMRYDHVGHEFGYIVTGMRHLFKGRHHAFRRLVYRNSQNYHDFEATMIWGSWSRGFSMSDDQGAALLGHEFTKVIYAEGAYVPEEIHERRVVRAVDGALMVGKAGIPPRETGFVTGYSTPMEFEGILSYETDRVFRAGRGDLTCMEYGKVPFAESVWIKDSVPVTANPAYPLEVFEARKRSMDPTRFAEQYGGQRGNKSGRVIPDFDEARHMIPLPPPDVIRSMRLGVGIDTGAFFAALLAGIALDGKCYVLGEVYEQQKKLPYCLDRVQEMIRTTLGPAFDSADFSVLRDRVDLWTVDPASQQKLEIIDQLGVTLQHPARGKGLFELLPTIDVVSKAFEADELYLCEDLRFLIDQLRKYVWRFVRPPGSKTFTVKEPKKVYDHLIDALRFIAIPLMESGPLPVARAPLTPEERRLRRDHEVFFGPLRRMAEAARRRGGIRVG